MRLKTIVDDVTMQVDVFATANSIHNFHKIRSFFNDGITCQIIPAIIIIIIESYTEYNEK